MATPPRDMREWMKSIDRKVIDARRSGQASASRYVDSKVEKIREDISKIDPRTPAAPVEVVAGSFVLETYNGKRRDGYVTLSSAPVVNDVDAQPITIGKYELWLKPDDGDPNATFTLQSSAVEPTLRSLPVTIGMTYLAKMRAVSSAGISGLFSEVQTILVTEDTTPPPVPSILTLTQRLGVIEMTWDGLSFGGAVMPLDFWRSEIGIRTGAESDYTVISEWFEGAGTSYHSGAPYNQPIYVSHRAYDYAGNVSDWTQPAIVTVLPVVDEDSIRQRIEEVEGIIDGMATEFDQMRLDLTNRLDAAELELQDNDQKLTQLITVDLPQLNSDLTANTDAVNNLETVTIPNLDTRLTDAQTEIDTNQAELTTRLDNAFIEIGTVDTKADGAVQDALDAQAAADKAKEYADTLALDTSGANLLSDPSFEYGTSHVVDSVTLNGTTTNFGTIEWVQPPEGAHHGTMALKSTLITGNSYVGIGVKVTMKMPRDGAGFRSSAWIYVDAEGAAATDALYVQSFAVNPVDQSMIAITGLGYIMPPFTAGWHYVSVDSTATVLDAVFPDEWELYFMVFASAPTPWVYVDQVSFVEITPALRARVVADQAAADALAAQQTAGTAIENANDALTMAGTKSTVTYSYNPPVGTGSPGDTHRQVNQSNDVIAEWRVSSTGVWIQQEITSDVISNLDVGKLTVGTAVISNAVIDKLWAEVITARKILAEQVIIGQGSNLVAWPFNDGTYIATGNSTELWGNYTWGSNPVLLSTNNSRIDGQIYVYTTISDITSTTLTLYPHYDSYAGESGGVCVAGEEFYGSFWVSCSQWINLACQLYFYSATGGYISSSVGNYTMTGNAWQKIEHSAVAPANAAFVRIYIRAGVFSGGSAVLRAERPELFKKSEGNLIVTGSITGDHLEVNSVATKVATVIKLNASTITSGTINTARLNTTEIAAATATIQKVNASNIVATSAAFSNAVIDKLWAEVIAARKITTEYLAVGNFNNMFVDPKFEDIAGGWSTTNATFSASDGYAGAPSVLIDSGTTQRGTYYIPPNREKLMQVEPGRSYRVTAFVRTSSAANARTLSMYIRLYDKSGAFEFPSNSNVSNTAATTAGIYTRLSGVIEVPSGGSKHYLTLGFYIQSGFTGSARFSGPVVTLMDDGELIVDGSVYARHIEASESMSAKIAQFLKVKAGMLEANAVTAGTIDAGAIDGISITGSVIRTSYSSSRIELNSSGIHAWQAGVKKFYLSASTGEITAVGTVQTGTDTTYRARLSNRDGIAALDIYGVGGDSAPHLAAIYINNTSVIRNYTNLSAYSSEMVLADDWAALRVTGGNYMQVGTGSGYIQVSGSGLLNIAPTFTTLKDASGAYLQMTASVSNFQSATGGSVYLSNTVTALTTDTGGEVRMDNNGMKLTSPTSGTFIDEVDLSGINTFFVPLITEATTTGGANVNSNNGYIREVASASRYKLNVRTIEDSYDDKILNVEAVTWNDKSDSEILADAMTPTQDGEESPKLPHGCDKRVPGVIAEQVLAAGLEEFVILDDAGEVQSVMYDRLGVALIPVVKRLRDHVSSLEARLDAAGL